MKFRRLAILFSKLENTSKRLEMIDILASFFREIKEKSDFSDLEKIIYLLQGQLVSNIKESPKLGIAEKLMIEALSIRLTLKSEIIKKELYKTGDIGTTAENLLTKFKTKQKTLFDLESPSIDISKLFLSFKKIIKSEGAGSQDIKLRMLREIIRDCTPLEIKYLFRIINSTLRVGVSTMTIIDGIAEGFTDSKEINRDFIERAFNLHPDLGDITKMLTERGIEDIKKIEITYGIPINMMLASRVPYLKIASKLGTPFIGEYKLDGERLQIHKQKDDVLLFSRRLLEITNQYPDVVQRVKENIKAENAIIEGEVVAMDAFYEKMLPFQVLSKRRRKYNVEDILKEVPVCLFLFDLLKFEDEIFIDKPLPKRRDKLEEIVVEREELRLVKSVSINSTDKLIEFFNEAREKGNEGIMAKSIQENSVYQAGNRGFLWIKLKGLEGGKLMDSVDVAVIGAFYGKGKRTGVYGTYIGAVYDPENDVYEAFTRVASGLTEEMMENLMKDMKQYKVEKKPNNVICEDTPDVWFKPEIVFEIIGDEITESEKFSSLGYSMRFPVFQRIRHDKNIKDITSVKEIKELYMIQF